MYMRSISIEQAERPAGEAEMHQETSEAASGQVVEEDARLWDCDSSLYDSFELKSFKRQIDSAIASRTLSMPRLAQVVSRPSPPKKKPSSRISRSLRKLLKPFSFRQKIIPATGTPTSTRYDRVDGRRPEEEEEEHYYVLYESTSGRVLLTTTVNIPETTTLSSGTTDGADYSGVGRAKSERFTGSFSPRGLMISCA
ncbi:hypothetical protein H6P81_014534 [Aristolochia fimbriata]|uniref:Uncharacterized protein n=1 Tax=Aristolochia fimbriata TaxID=158543 RepID=A0AAV7EKK7_ARIFI|nr:hypothetical protein H6P81_014534 [Aristolochia fimbriata]